MAGHVEFVRRVYEEDLLDRDIEAIVERCHSDVVFVNPEEAVEAGTRRGRDALRALGATFADSFAWSEHALHRLYSGDEIVVAEITFRARGKESGIDLEQHEVHSWTFRGGRVVRFEWGRDLQAALAAARLSGDPGL